MVLVDRSTLRRFPDLLVTAGVVLAALAATIAAVSAASPGPRSPFPGFLLDRGRYIPFEASDPRVRIVPIGINNRGEIIGEYIRPRSESGMLRGRRGRITSFDVPGARVRPADSCTTAVHAWDITRLFYDGDADRWFDPAWIVTA